MPRRKQPATPLPNMNKSVLARAGRTVPLLILPFVVVAAAWTIAAPRLRVVALGDGTGSPTYGSSGAEVSATIMLSAMLFGAGAAAALVLWRRHSRLRALPPALWAWLGIGALGAVTSTASLALARLVFSADTNAAEGTIIELAPRLARQVMTAGQSTQAVENIAMAAWAASGALTVWFVAAYMSFGRDLR